MTRVCYQVSSINLTPILKIGIALNVHLIVSWENPFNEHFLRIVPSSSFCFLIWRTTRNAWRTVSKDILLSLIYSGFQKWTRISNLVRSKVRENLIPNTKYAALFLMRTEIFLKITQLLFWSTKRSKIKKDGSSSQRAASNQNWKKKRLWNTQLKFWFTN